MASGKLGKHYASKSRIHVSVQNCSHHKRVHSVAELALARVLKINTEMVCIITSFVLAGAALAFGVSFGPGTRDVVRNMAAGFYARRVLETDKNTEVAGRQGVLKAITATHTILEYEGRDIGVSSATLLDQIAKQ